MKRAKSSVKTKKLKTKEIYPRRIFIEWEGSVYEFSVSRSFHRLLNEDVFEAENEYRFQGDDETPRYYVQIWNAFGIRTLEELQRAIKWGFENQKNDHGIRVARRKLAPTMRSIFMKLICQLNAHRLRLEHQL